MKRVATLLAVGLIAVLSACGPGKPPGTPVAVEATSGAPVDGVDSGGGTAPTICARAVNLAPLGVSVMVNNQNLTLPDGTAYTLDTIPGGPTDGYQTCDGWLVHGWGNGSDTMSLWLVSRTGAPRVMVDKADAPVAVGADGRRLAWRTGGKIYFGHVDPANKAVVDKSTTAPARGAPIAVGTDSVVLGYSETGGGVDKFDTWIPSLGDYKATWDKTAHVRAVYRQSLADGSYLGLVQGPAGAKDLCLAVMNAKANLTVTKKACGFVTQLDDSGSVSPDGHWLVMFAASSTGDGQIALVDLTKVFSTPAVTSNWAAVGGWAWEDSNNLLVASGGSLRRFHVGSLTPDPVLRPGLVSASKLVPLPRLG